MDIYGQISLSNVTYHLDKDIWIFAMSTFFYHLTVTPRLKTDDQKIVVILPPTKLVVRLNNSAKQNFLDRMFAGGQAFHIQTSPT